MRAGPILRDSEKSTEREEPSPHLRNNRRLELSSLQNPEPRPPPADSGSHPPRRGCATATSRGRHPACNRGEFAGTGGRCIPLPGTPGGARATIVRGMVPPRRAALRLAAIGRRAAGGYGSHSALQVEGGAYAGEGSRGTTADSDPGRAGPRRSAAATRLPGARKSELNRHLLPPARRLACAGQRKEGRRPPRQVGAERGPHPATREAAEAGRPGLRNLRPGPSHCGGHAGPTASVRVPRTGSGPAGGEGTSGGGGAGVPGLPLRRSLGTPSRTGGRGSGARSPGEAQRR